MRCPIVALALLVSALVAACNGGDSGALRCKTNDYGCICSSLVTQDEGIACTAADQGSDGFCCRENDSDPCYCVRAACVASLDSSACTCGADMFDPIETRVSSCAPPVGGHCCKSHGSSLGAQCSCSSLTCDSGEIEVASCTTQLVSDCGASYIVTDRCN